MFAEEILRTLPELRGLAESLMLDTCKAIRVIGTDYVNGSDVEVTEPIFGSDLEPVPCKVKPATRSGAQEAAAGGRTVVTVPAEVHLPAKPEYAVLVDGDLIVIVTVHPLSLSREGRRYRVVGEVDGSLVTACRYTVERNTT